MGNLKNAVTKTPVSFSQLEHVVVARNFLKNPQLSTQTAALAESNPEKILHVMSYNVLADRLASLRKFRHTTAPVLDFDFRGPRIVDEIKNSRASIICMQEVDRVKDFYRPRMEGFGMQLIHYKRPRFFQNDGIAIAYRSEDVRLLDTEYVDLNDLTNVYNNHVFSQNNQAMFCLFEHIRSRKRIIAGNLHLHFNPEKDFIKFAQASYVLERGANFAK